MKTTRLLRAAAQDRLHLRALQIEDYDRVVALWRRTEGVGLNESDTRASIAAYLRRNPRLSFVAEQNGRIIGTVLCGHDGRRGTLYHLAVAKRYRGQGIGRQLVEACLVRLDRLGISRCNIFVFAENAEGLEFWQHTGWNLRAEIRTMQIKLAENRGAKRTCSC